jgi:serine/threonine-protein kinase
MVWCIVTSSHRDIKPENILLSKQHALVTDFGVAKAVDEATGRQALTTAGVALGTPTYMAPEQAAADPHIDHRADIYAVGALGYELLTGRPPFMGPTAQSILTAHVTQAPEDVSQHRPTVPPALAQLIMRCLEKKPADRWQRADELLAVLPPPPRARLVRCQGRDASRSWEQVPYSRGWCWRLPVGGSSPTEVAQRPTLRRWVTACGSRCFRSRT